MWRDFYYNNKSLKPRRRELRNNPTDSEITLWQTLRRSQLGQRFIRQYSVSGYVIDFYCPKLRLAIEVDGEIHEQINQIIYDKYREKYLNSADIKIVHVKNIEIVNNIGNVVYKIKSYFPS